MESYKEQQENIQIFECSVANKKYRKELIEEVFKSSLNTDKDFLELIVTTEMINGELTRVLLVQVNKEQCKTALLTSDILIQLLEDSNTQTIVIGKEVQLIEEFKRSRGV